MAPHKIQLKLWAAPTTVDIWVENEEVRHLVPEVVGKIPGKFEFMEIVEASGGPLYGLEGMIIRANDEALLTALSLHSNTAEPEETFILDEAGQSASSLGSPHAQIPNSESCHKIETSDTPLPDSPSHLSSMPSTESKLNASDTPLAHRNLTRRQLHGDKKQRKAQRKNAKATHTISSTSGLSSYKFKNQIQKHGVAQAMHLLDRRMKKTRGMKMKKAEARRWNAEGTGMEVEINEESKIRMLDEALKKL